MNTNPAGPSADRYAGGSSLNLTPLLPKWARVDAFDGRFERSEAASLPPSGDLTGHYPTLPLPAAGTSAIALVVTMMAAKAGLRFLRYFRHRYGAAGRFFLYRLIRRQGGIVFP